MFQPGQIYFLYARRLSSSSACSPPSRLWDYGFKPPPISFTPLPSSDPSSSSSGGGSRLIDNKKPKKQQKKPPYRPPSSLLDAARRKPLHSDLPFDFRFSYTESDPGVRPIGLREPKYSPFGPNRFDRTWTGVSAPALDPKAAVEEVGGESASDELRQWRDRIQGAPLSPAEQKSLVERSQRHRTSRQINLGRDGLTHNMLNDVHNNWKTVEAVRIKCLGVPTVDMKNVCKQLEEKSGGQIIHKQGGLLILYRGRHYNPKKRPVVPLMLWKPHEPIYPRLIKTTIEGLSIEETKEMRKRGLAVPALTKLAKNGYYGSLVPMVQDAFLSDELVRIDCKGLEKSDYKKIGCKLRNLVPCVLVTFEKEQIVMWRGKSNDTTINQESSEELVQRL